MDGWENSLSELIANTPTPLIEAAQLIGIFVGAFVALVAFIRYAIQGWQKTIDYLARATRWSALRRAKRIAAFADLAKVATENSKPSGIATFLCVRVLSLMAFSASGFGGLLLGVAIFDVELNIRKFGIIVALGLVIVSIAFIREINRIIYLVHPSVFKLNNLVRIESLLIRAGLDVQMRDQWFSNNAILPDTESEQILRDSRDGVFDKNHPSKEE